MILVDSSVWIDYFRGVLSPETDRLDSLLGQELLITGDLIVAEVLQGFQPESEFNTAKRLMTGNLAVVSLVGPEIAVQAARNYRALRANGITVRKTIDTLIATYCIENGHSLLFSDRDFNPFVDYLGLRSALIETRQP
ncbi:type II toxin-antitoxin system VapC family toxin [Thauera sinica]|uniref:PIN domain nuclease n=1 Tax=Thauera sinica TaxID=2665146 RepID=A0ABW1APJ6_9RHOO|nr:PIN domain nuclease [Thauera sp. K11]ATE60093.1 VapC toxin family PIN domain ribonuclease [Thauera sp. K11]